MKLSVIVPIYNVEKYLPRCLDSLLRQGMSTGEWEIICVNDGSPDNCGYILADYERKYPDIFKVITQKNQGLGGARNTGTAQAQGEYVTYLDSDDYLINGSYSYLLEHFCQDKPDVLCYDWHHIYTNGKILYDQHAMPDGEVSFDGDGVEAYNRYPLPYVWSKFYKRSFLEQYHIKSQIVTCQDELFNFDVFRHHPHTRIVSSNVCRYEKCNSNSIQRISEKKIVMRQLEDMFRNIENMRHYLDGDETDLRPAAMRNINNFLNVYHKKLWRLTLSWKEWHTFRKKMKGLPSYIPVLDGNTQYERWQGLAKKWAGSNYLFYLIVCCFLRNFIFARFIRPLMVGKVTGGS